MRILLTIVVLAGALATWAPDADAGRRSWRGPPPPPGRAPPPRYGYGYNPYYHRGGSVCQERANFFDPNRTFGGFPCWARSAFGQGRR